MAEQKQLQWYHYVDNNGAARAIMLEKDWGDSASSGCTTVTGTEITWGGQSRLHRVRKVIYRDPTTFRVSGKLSIDELNGVTGLHIPDESFDTVGGWVLDLFGLETDLVRRWGEPPDEGGESGPRPRRRKR